LCELKRKEFDIEEGLIHAQTHPQYIQALKDIDDHRNSRQQEAVNRLGNAIKAAENDCSAEMKRSLDTFNVFLSVTKDGKEPIENEACCKIPSFYQHAKKRIPSFYQRLRTLTIGNKNINLIGGSSTMSTTSAAILYQRRRMMMEGAASGTRRLKNNEMDLPDWTRRVVTASHHAGYSRIWVPSLCDGLDQHEMDEDMEFIKLLTTNCMENNSVEGQV
jgi:hypothetical protein